MKKILLFSFVLFSSCQDQSKILFTGYLVGKEFHKQRMSNESEKIVNYSIIVPHIVNTPHAPPPHKIEKKWLWYIANKNEVICKQVTSSLFNTKKLGQKVTIKKY